MRIAISATGRDLDSSLDPRFGRCPYFLLVDPETQEYQVVPNPGISAGGGAGIKAAQEVVKQGVKTLITGQCGPNAFEILAASGIRVLQAPCEPVRKVLELYERGELSEINAPGMAKQGMRGRGLC